jgi:general secretion pathway protein F
VLLPFFLIALRVIGGGVFWRTWCGQLPLIGPLWRWLALAGWARWLALLIDARVPLADGVRLAGSAVGDLRVEAAANRLATRVALGGGIGLAMAAADEWPATATTLVSWGERSQALSASLRALAETCEARARMRARWTRLVAPPFAFLFVGAMVGVAYWTMLSPILQIMRFLA